MAQPNSPEWWLDRLSKRLDARSPSIRRYCDFYRGDQPMAFATNKFREAFGSLFQHFADDWCALVVDAAVERLTVQGFRFGGDATAAADDAAWSIWQTNGLDALAPIAHTEAVKTGYAYLLVGPPPAPDMPAVITPEHPLTAIVEHDPANPRVRLAGLKRWQAPDETWRATVYLPDGVYRFMAKRTEGGMRPSRWVPLPDQPVVPNPLGVVPLIELRNNPDLLIGGTSDIHKVIPIQTAVNKLCSDMLVAAEYAAFRQRYVVGLEVPADDDGKPLPGVDLTAAQSRLWMFEDPNTQVGEFAASDLSNYVRAVEMYVQHIAAQTRTPPHYLLGSSGTFPSGESLKATETGLVAKVRRKMLDFGEGWEEAIRLAFRFVGDEVRGSATDAEVIWADPESRTEGEHVDALLKLQALGVPNEALWERAGFTPQQIARFKAQQADEAAVLGLAVGVPTMPADQGLAAPVTIDTAADTPTA